ncbi:hypothetical protein [Ciceribacter sp. RN22]|uniref:hypothetical protein n=1 Tax=Ciceribacter sp. RN22 TaxID=2954932 RepID=UPI0020926A38|nr:hypothetical protein [Ciceribacter sp. RN22]MCO6179529.1 hypothetical protein [Ciceribacter sp. RN22]
MSRQVLLARPHPFIVGEMKPWLEQGGYSVKRPDHVDDLASHARACAGAVISLAVSSSIAASAADVVKIVRQANPSLPILFAALRPYSQIRPEIERLLQGLGIAGAVLGADQGTGSLLPGGSKMFLYVSKDDLSDATRSSTARALLVKHFG